MKKTLLLLLTLSACSSEADRVTYPVATPTPTPVGYVAAPVSAQAVPQVVYRDVPQHQGATDSPWFWMWMFGNNRSSNPTVEHHYVTHPSPSYSNSYAAPSAPPPSRSSGYSSLFGSSSTSSSSSSSYKPSTSSSSSSRFSSPSRSSSSSSSSRFTGGSSRSFSSSRFSGGRR